MRAVLLVSLCQRSLRKLTHYGAASISSNPTFSVSGSRDCRRMVSLGGGLVGSEYQKYVFLPVCLSLHGGTWCSHLGARLTLTSASFPSRHLSLLHLPPIRLASIAPNTPFPLYRVHAVPLSARIFTLDTLLCHWPRYVHALPSHTMRSGLPLVWRTHC